MGSPGVVPRPAISVLLWNETSQGPALDLLHQALSDLINPPAGSDASRNLKPTDSGPTTGVG